jgi:hypothetical protein
VTDKIHKNISFTMDDHQASMRHKILQPIKIDIEQHLASQVEDDNHFVTICSFSTMSRALTQIQTEFYMNDETTHTRREAITTQAFSFYQNTVAPKIVSRNDDDIENRQQRVIIQCDSFHLISNDVLNYIFEYLTPRDCARVDSTCKYWYSMMIDRYKKWVIDRLNRYRDYMEYDKIIYFIDRELKGNYRLFAFYSGVLDFDFDHMNTIMKQYTVGLDFDHNYNRWISMIITLKALKHHRVVLVTTEQMASLSIIPAGIIDIVDTVTTCGYTKTTMAHVITQVLCSFNSFSHSNMDDVD